MRCHTITAYSLYSKQAQSRTKINPLEEIYPSLPNKKYQVIYADPPWDYGGKMQYDKTTIKDENVGFEKKIFISSAAFKYPTLKMKQLKQLDVNSIAADDCILFYGLQDLNWVMPSNWEKHGDLSIKQLLLYGIKWCTIRGDTRFPKPNLFSHLKKANSQHRVGREILGSCCPFIEENIAKNPLKL